MKITSTRRQFVAGSTAVAGTLAMPAVLRAQPVSLTISHYVPPTHGIEVDLLRPWADNLVEQTGGAVEYEIHSVASAYGRADRQADQVRAGVVDIAFGLSGIPRGRFPHTSIIELPFLVEDTRQGSPTLWHLYQEGRFGGEYDDFHLLALMTHHGALLHTVDRPIHELADLRGLRVRSPGPAVNAMLEYLGASPVGMPPAQIYESLERGAIDGVATTWDLVGAIRLNEVLRHHTDARVYVAAFYIAMNRDKYDSLPAEVRQVIDETSGENWLASFGPLWDKWEARGKEDAESRDNNIITIDEATREEWHAELQPMIEAYLDSLRDEGVEDPHGLYEEMVALVAHYGG